MSVINNGILLGAGADAATGYQISRSLRFDSSSSAYLNWTPGSAGNRKTWTWAGWVKRSALGSTQVIFSAFSGGGGNYFILQFVAGDNIQAYFGPSVGELKTTAVYRDISAWYHIALAYDTTQATSSDRIKLYVNGTQVTVFSVASYPSLDNASNYVNAALAHSHGCFNPSSPSDFFNGYLADIHFCDGNAYTPSSFTETDATTGQLIPKAFTGSYGTNGFRLPFSDNSGTTATTLGKDAAGSNNWTPNNFSVASGAGNDSLVDSPTGYGTDTGAGGEVRGSYCTANPLDNGGQTLANGNLDVTGVASNWRGTRGTFGMSSGKWYWEITIGFTNSANNQSLLGIAKSAAAISSDYASAGVNGWEYYSSNGNKFNNGSAGSYGSGYTLNDVIGVAFDADNGTLTFYKNGTSQGTAFTGLTSGPYFPSFSLYSSSLVSVNWGARPFAYTAPSGFKALCSHNLPEPTILKGNTAMDVKLWTGNGGTQTISGLGFDSDLIAIKCRSNGTNFIWMDSVRGITNKLASNGTWEENNSTQLGSGDGYVSSTSSTGFTVTNGSQTNQSSQTYAAWCFDCGSSTVTNTSGTISSQVRASATNGCSVVTYTGTGSAATVGHGLGVAPELIITKSRNNTYDWTVYHKSLGISQYLFLNSTAAASSGSNYWNTAPTSTIFGVGNNNTGSSGSNIVAYCFAPVAGFSAFGSYTGNGSSDGPFVFTGFRPRYIMYKSSSNVGSWDIRDTSRSTYNTNDLQLYADLSQAETSYGVYIDVVSNGFKIRSNNASYNGNGYTYIYAAFAESPFKYSRAR